MSWRLASLICISYIFWVKCQADDAVVPDEAHLSTESIAGGIPKISTLESSTTEIPTLESSTILESSTTKIATVATVTQSDKAHNDSLSLEIFVKPENLTGWTDWFDQSSCSSSCGRGTKTQERNCTITKCEGADKRTQPCNSGPCPTWLSWSVWSACSTCGVGQQQRSRICTAANKCSGTATETKACVKPQCNLASWSQWTTFTSCSNEKNCGTGTSVRQRDCPAGKKCLGHQNETRSCIINSAPVCGIWTSWSDWSTCSRSCNGGVQRRTRMCAGGTLTPVCAGYTDDFHACNPQPCHTWSDWQMATDCSGKCGGVGMRNRKRTCEDQLCTGPSEENLVCLNICT